MVNLFDISPRQDWLTSILQKVPSNSNSDPHSLPASAPAEGQANSKTPAPISTSDESIQTFLKANPHLYSPSAGWKDPLAPGGIEEIVNSILQHFGVSESRELVRASRPTARTPGGSRRFRDGEDGEPSPSMDVDVDLDVEENEDILYRLEYAEDVVFERDDRGNVYPTIRRRRRVDSPFSPKPFIFSSRTRTPSVLRVENDEDYDDDMDLGSGVGLGSGAESRSSRRDSDSNSMSEEDIFDFSRCVSLLAVQREKKKTSDIVDEVDSEIDDRLGTDVTLNQLAAHVQQCFNQQLHRQFIFVLLLSVRVDVRRGEQEIEKQQQQHITLYSFDRSGLVASQALPIHNTIHNTMEPKPLEAATLFVRLVLLVSSPDPTSVGIDPAWFFRDGVKHVRVKGPGGGLFRHVRYVEHFEDGSQVNLSSESGSESNLSLESRRWLFGLAPACHLVEKVEDVEGTPMDSFSPNASTRRCILKESWREEDQVAEYDLLKALDDVRNVSGAGELGLGLGGGGSMLIGYDDNADDDEFNTRSLRPTLVCPAEPSLPPPSPMSSDNSEDHAEEGLVLPVPVIFPLSDNNYKGRIQTRLVREDFGPTIDQWRDPVELLEGLLDIVKEVKALFDVGIIHGDISIQNILLNRRARGDSSSSGGPCPNAMLVNFDRAIQFRTGRGVRQNQSVQEDPPSLLFQSIALLNQHTPDHPPHPRYAPNTPRQDYLDDLESILWLLVYFSFELSVVPQTDIKAPEWRKPIYGYLIKYTFLQQFGKYASRSWSLDEKEEEEEEEGKANCPALRHVGLALPRWDPFQKPLCELLIRLGRVLEPLVIWKKLDGCWYEAMPEAEDRRKELESEAGRVFGMFERAFERAIKEVRERGREELNWESKNWR